MKETNNFTNDVIRNVEDEASKVIDEIVEEIENEALQIVEDTIEDPEKVAFEESVEQVEEEIEEEITQEAEEAFEEEPLPKNMKKNAKAHHLVQKAKKIVQEANERTRECRLLLEADLKDYHAAKERLGSGGLDECVSLVEKLGYQSNEDQPQEETNIVVFEAKEELKPIVLKDISSGKFTGLLLALFGGAATSIGSNPSTARWRPRRPGTT